MSSRLRHLRVGLRCDAGPAIGVGHAVRLLALAEEFQARGAHVVLLGRIDIPWLSAEYDSHGVDLVEAANDPTALVRSVTEHDLDVVVLDGYDLDASSGSVLREAGVFVVAMVDDRFGASQEADLYVDQNLGARPRSPLPARGVAVAGLEYALFRDVVLDRVRPVGQAPDRAAQRVLAVFGGTDPFGAAAVLAPLILSTGEPLELTVVAPDAAARQSISTLATRPGQRVEVVAALPDLAAVAARSDVVVSASGSSVWEMLCLGVPTATVCVTDNQEPGYRETVARGVTVGLGHLDDLRGADADVAVDRLRRLLRDPDQRRMLAARGRELVDGRGRQRVVDHVTERLRGRSGLGA